MERKAIKSNINFLKLRYVCGAISLMLIVFSFYIWLEKGDAKYSVDFVGGTEVVVDFKKPLEIGVLRKALDQAGLSGAVVQAFISDSVSEFSIRIKGSSAELVGAEEAELAAGEGDTAAEKPAKTPSSTVQTGKLIRDALSSIEGNSFEMQKEDFVGPTIGQQIRDDGVKAIIWALIAILAYVSFRFEWRFAVGAVVALAHDVIITTGIFIASEREISAAVLAALLTIIGYSLNDTIIIFDRVRENLGLAEKASERKAKKRALAEDSELVGVDLSSLSLLELFNYSINQTLSRTILTSLTTLFVVVTLWLLGGGAVADLAYTLVIGIVVGTYSTVFVASAIVLALAKRR